MLPGPRGDVLTPTPNETICSASFNNPPCRTQAGPQFSSQDTLTRRNHTERADENEQMHFRVHVPALSRSITVEATHPEPT